MAKSKKHNLQWIKETLDLNPDHNWKSSPGNSIFVAGRGAVRFEVPQDWHFEPDDNSFRFLDRKLKLIYSNFYVSSSANNIIFKFLRPTIRLCIRSSDQTCYLVH